MPSNWIGLNVEGWSRAEEWAVLKSWSNSSSDMGYTKRENENKSKLLLNGPRRASSPALTVCYHLQDSVVFVVYTVVPGREEVRRVGVCPVDAAGRRRRGGGGRHWSWRWGGCCRLRSWGRSGGESPQPLRPLSAAEAAEPLQPARRRQVGQLPVGLVAGVAGDAVVAQDVVAP